MSISHPRSRKGIAEGAAFLVFAVLYFLVLAYEGWLDPVPWRPSAGLGFAALLLGRARYVPALLLGAAAVAFWLPPGPGGPGRLLTDTAASVVCYGLVGEALRRWVGVDLTLQRPRDASLLVLAGLGASLGFVAARAAFLDPSGLAAADGYTLEAASTWLRDVIGIVAVAPLVLIGHTIWFTTGPGGFRRIGPETLEGLAQIASLCLILWLNFGVDATAGLDLFELHLLPIVWMALRRGVVGGCVGVAVTNVGIAVGLAVSGAARGDMHELQALMLSVSVLGLLLGASVSARELAANALRQARDAAEAANRAKSAFLANVSHELRTPMNSILGYTDLVLDGVDGPVNSEQRGSLERVRKHARGLLRMIDNLIGFSETEHGESPLRAVPFDLPRLVREVSMAFSSAARDKGLTISRSISPAVPDTIFGDRERLGRALRELVGNAVKFTEAGEVSLGVSVDGAEAGETRLRFAVRDTGIGIPKEKQTMIFKAFSLADSSHTRPHGGIGLGLALARRNVGLLGGDLRVESEVGRGTIFLFSIPCRVTEE